MTSTCHQGQAGLGLQAREAEGESDQPRRDRPREPRDLRPHQHHRRRGGDQQRWVTNKLSSKYVPIIDGTVNGNVKSIISTIKNQSYLKYINDYVFFKERESINIDEVETIKSIMKRFGSGSMSHGALSKEAHETLAIGMNRIKVLHVVEKEEKMKKGLKLLKMEIVQIQE